MTLGGTKWDLDPRLQARRNATILPDVCPRDDLEPNYSAAITSTASQAWHPSRDNDGADNGQLYRVNTHLQQHPGIPPGETLPDASTCMSASCLQQHPAFRRGNEDWGPFTLHHPDCLQQHPGIPPGEPASTRQARPSRKNFNNTPAFRRGNHLGGHFLRRVAHISTTPRHSAGGTASAPPHRPHSPSFQQHPGIPPGELRSRAGVSPPLALISTTPRHSAGGTGADWQRWRERTIEFQQHPGIPPGEPRDEGAFSGLVALFQQHPGIPPGEPGTSRWRRTRTSNFNNTPAFRRGNRRGTRNTNPHGAFQQHPGIPPGERSTTRASWTPCSDFNNTPAFRRGNPVASESPEQWEEEDFNNTPAFRRGNGLSSNLLYTLPFSLQLRALRSMSSIWLVTL